MGSTLLTLFTPDSALAPLLVTAGLLTIFGFRKPAGGIIIFVLACAFSPMFEPFIEALLGALPDWVILLLVVFIVLQVLRFVLEVFLGKEAGGHILAGIVRSQITWSISALLGLYWWATSHLV